MMQEEKLIKLIKQELQEIPFAKLPQRLLFIKTFEMMRKSLINTNQRQSNYVTS